MPQDPEILAPEIDEAVRAARLTAARLLDLAIRELEAQRTQAARRLGRLAAVWRRKANLLGGA